MTRRNERCRKLYLRLDGRQTFDQCHSSPTLLRILFFVSRWYPLVPYPANLFSLTTQEILTQHHVPAQARPGLEILAHHPSSVYNIFRINKPTSQRAKTKFDRIRLLLTSQPRSSDRQHHIEIRIRPTNNRVRTIRAYPCAHASLV